MDSLSWKKEKEKLGKLIISSLYQEGMIKTWYRDKSEGWVLVSRIWSPFYIQLRPLSSFPKLLQTVGRAMGQLVRYEISKANKLVGVAMAGIPIATAIALDTGIPAVFTRKLLGVRTVDDFRRFVEEYGEHSMVEGDLSPGDTLIVVDDLVTRFDSKLIAIKQVEHEAKLRDIAGVKCGAVVVLLDREQGAQEKAQELNIGLHSLIKFRSEGLYWLRDKMEKYEYQVIEGYLENPDEYQNPELIEKLKRESVAS